MVTKDAIKDFHQDKYNGEYGGRYRCKLCVNEQRREYGRRKPWMQQKYRNGLKREVLSAYSTSLRCVCCFETTFKFLTLDHVYNDGKQDRESCKNAVFQKLKREGFPNKDKYQVLCFNCNFGKAVNKGVCPHKDI